jgi:hypothetical protein
MNTHIRAQNSQGMAALSSARRDGANKTLQPNATLPSNAHKHPPGPGVRALCAAFLSAPILLGLYLSIQQPPLFTFCSRLFTFVHDLKISWENSASPPSRLPFQNNSQSTTR